MAMMPALHHRKTIVQLSSSLPIFNMEMEEGYYSYSSLCGALAVTVAGWLVYRWMNPPCNTGRLPPGSMGFPLVGETFRFFKPSPSIDIPAFYKQSLKRYSIGPSFLSKQTFAPLYK
jgi:hypothetical protein